MVRRSGPSRRSGESDTTTVSSSFNSQFRTKEHIMEWVTITAATVEDAKTLALDQLGVAPEDAEIETL